MTPWFTAQRFRRIALALEGAIEGAHMGHPDFRVNDRIFASLHHDDQFGMVNLTPDQQASFLERGSRPGSEPAAVNAEPEPGTRNLQRL